MTKILLVEDDPVIGRGLEINLGNQGYKIIWAQTLADANLKIQEDIPDLILLDLNLPDGNGLELCTKLRDHDSIDVPIIILTANIEEESAVESFNKGANDYIRKPFGNAELTARIKNALNIKAANEDRLRFEKLHLCLNQRQAFYDGVELKLNRREFDILAYLMRSPSFVLSREQLIENLGGGENIVDRTIDSHLSRIRQKFKKIENCSLKITSIYGVGYKLETT